MNKSEIIEKLRIIFADIVQAEEDNIYDDPEFITGKAVDFIEFRFVDGETFLHLAALRGELEAAKLLVELGIDVNLLGDMGNTALHYAATHKHRDIYDYLVSKGASDGIINEFGETPSQYLKEQH